MRLRKVGIFGLYATYVSAIVLVAFSWLASGLFVSMILLLSDLPGSRVALVATPVVAGLVAYLLGQHLKRQKTLRQWLLPTLVLALTPASAVWLAPVLFNSLLRHYELDGPTSPAGLRVVMDVRDAGLGIGADHFCDVLVLDENANVIVKWSDPNGWGRRDGPAKQRDSAKWTSATTLEFESVTGPVMVQVP